jgi:phenylpropionate dioxygenase-like ring-hydroxylating dioxygenase large terminal subunit
LQDDACGHVKSFFCRYHAWTFDLDGQVTAIPDRDAWNGCPHNSDADFSMGEVKSGIWAGWVWINMNPDCIPLEQFLSPLLEKTDCFEWENCRIRSYQTLIFPINWKVALEAFCEGYHVIGTHQQLLRFGNVVVPGTEETLADPGPRHGSHYGRFAFEFEDLAFDDPRDYVAANMLELYNTLHGIIHDEGARAARRLLEEAPPGLSLIEAFEKFGALQKEEVIKSGARWPERMTGMDLMITEWQVFPNCSILPAAEGAFWYRARPNGDDPDSCIFDVISLGRYAPGKEPAWEHEFYPTLESFKGQNPILEQDFSNMLAVHKGMRSRGWQAARANPVQESNVYNLHRVLHQYIYSDEQ